MTHPPRLSISLPLLAAGAVSAVFAAEPVPPLPQVVFSGTPPVWTAVWPSIDLRAYYMQLSEDLVAWSYLPLIKTGDGSVLSHTFDSTTPKRFFRLVFDPVKLTATAEMDDDDGDGVGNLAELLAHFDPRVPDSFTSADGDAIADAMEQYWFGNTASATNTSDNGGSGIRDVFEIQAGLDPRADETAMSGKRTNYLYDPMGRLTHAGGDAGSHDFAFDAEGNLESATATRP